MIDRIARDKLADQIRHLVAGLTTNDDFEEEVLAVETDDRAYWAIVDQAWFLYSDLYQHKLRGSHAISKQERRIICTFILFLHSDLEYEWSEHPCTGFVRIILGMVSLGWLPRYFDERWKLQGDYEVYPFIRLSDFEKARAHPRFLAGIESV
jgi:hypothetical protein